MSISIDFERAKGVLLAAKQTREMPSDEIVELLKKVICGSHKTYRYILVTNLLAKATEPKANALCLQAKSSLRGAFDSRSLCHKVVVPFEREYLANALGASNEPYLNKPARFKKLSLRNAVRAGIDREILSTLIQIADMVNKENGAELARKCLSACFVLLERTISNNELMNTVNTIVTPDLIDIYTFIARFIEESFEGETCAAVVGAVEKQFYARLKGEYTVVVHKVNESGASSKEIGDIDVYENDKCFYSIEVKDKAFTVYDVEHAFSKMIAAQVKRGSFVYGPRAKFDSDKVKITLYSFEQQKFVTLFMEILPYVRLVLFKTPNVEKMDFIQILMNTVREINGRDCTVNRIHQVASELFHVKNPLDR